MRHSLVFVSACFADRHLARETARKLRSAGCQTTSRWHEADHTPESVAKVDANRELRRKVAADNYEDLRKAGSLLLLAHPDGRGSLCEAATAYYQGKHVAIVGHPDHVTLMLDLPGIEWFESVDQAVEHMTQERR